MTAPAAPTTTEKAARTKTAYVVLEQREDTVIGGHTWTEVATIFAPTAAAAVKQAVEQSGDAGTYLAIPERSWTPITVTLDTKTVVTLS